MTWKNSNYSSSDMLTMQQDAVRRVREMQRIANSRLNSQPSSPPKSEGARFEKSAGVVRQETLLPPKATPAPSEKATMPADTGNPLGGLLSQLNLEGDRLIILMLLIVLLNEGADQKLLLALCYLLL